MSKLKKEMLGRPLYIIGRFMEKIFFTIISIGNRKDTILVTIINLQHYVNHLYSHSQWKEGRSLYDHCDHWESRGEISRNYILSKSS